MSGSYGGFRMGAHRPFLGESRNMCSFTWQGYVLLGERLEEVYGLLGMNRKSHPPKMCADKRGILGPWGAQLMCNYFSPGTQFRGLGSHFSFPESAFGWLDSPGADTTLALVKRSPWSWATGPHCPWVHWPMTGVAGERANWYSQDESSYPLDY